MNPSMAHRQAMIRMQDISRMQAIVRVRDRNRTQAVIPKQSSDSHEQVKMSAIRPGKFDVHARQFALVHA